jgi:hypothetical protein
VSRVQPVWDGLVAVLQTLPSPIRVYADRPPRLETPCVFPTLLSGSSEMSNACTVRDRLQLGVVLAVGEADTAERGSLARGYFDQVLDVLDTELTAHQPFGAEFGTRTGITALQGFAEAAFAWQANLELRVTQAF